ncbi:MAG: glycosyltransferase [bacterium]|nr:glycosyltransferase [bacterium]
MLAPIVVFVYNRPDHAEKMFDSLSACNLAKHSELYIFSDGPKNSDSAQGVKQVRELINSERLKELFKSVEVIESEKNNGLANSVISGVDKVLKKYGRVIVVEDDCIVAPDFLDYMNAGLEFYEHNPKIWSLGGQTIVKDIPQHYQHDVMVLGRTCSCAWATWLDRWQKVDWQVSDYSKFKRSFSRRKQFNEFGADRSIMLDYQMHGLINSWAIRFCYAMFKNGMYTVYPTYSKVQNIGYDGSGTHCAKVCDSVYAAEIVLQDKSVEFENVELDPQIAENYRKLFHATRWELFKRKVKMYFIIFGLVSNK